MKIHKVTSDRIFFITDTGAYGSVLKEDVSKLVKAVDLPEGKIDARTGSCMTDSPFEGKSGHATSLNDYPNTMPFVKGK